MNPINTRSWLNSFARGAALLLALQSVFVPLGWAAATEQPVMLSRRDVTTYLAVQAKLTKNDSISIDDLDGTFGTPPKNTYSTDDVALYLKAKTQQATLPTNQNLVKKSGYQGPKKFPWLRLRRSFQDVLTAEDPSLTGGGVTEFDDLEGALFSYSRDLRNDNETWSAQAALLAPFSFYTGYAPLKSEPLGVARWGFEPSLSLNRLSTSGDPSDEVEQLTYRIGAFMKLQSGHKWLLALTGRVFASYLNDSLRDQSVTAGEFELEPVSVFAPWLKIGTRTILIPKENENDIHDTAWIAYQFRTILHGEWGSLNSEGPLFAGKEYNFFRLGPVLQLDFKPFIFKDLSISLKYRYLPAVSGENRNDSLFTADAEWAIYTNEDRLQKLSLKMSYVDGGLELTKEKARTLLIGLGAAF